MGKRMVRERRSLVSLGLPSPHFLSYVSLFVCAQLVTRETAVLPLLREQEGAGGQSRTSTAEERVIGAGLKALEKHEDGEAVKELFHMFAVTQVSASDASRTSVHAHAMHMMMCRRRTSCIR